MAEKQRQLEVEEKEVHRERNALLNRKHTVEALQHEIEYMEGVVASRKEASVASAAARDAAAGALRKYKLGAKLKEAAIKASAAPEPLRDCLLISPMSSVLMHASATGCVHIYAPHPRVCVPCR